MSEGIKIEIVSPEARIYAGEVESATVPGEEGYFTLMGQHAPLMSVLKPGFVTIIKTGTETETFYVQGGFAEVNDEELTILAEDARPISAFDKDEILKAIEEAQERLDKAETHQERHAAELIVYAFRNLMEEAQHLGPTASM